MKNIIIAVPTLILTPLALFVLALLVYNNTNRNVLAQETELVCESPEIPVGAATDATLLLAKGLLTNVQSEVSAALSQIAVAEQLLGLPDQCRADNCAGSCATFSSALSCGRDTSECLTVNCPTTVNDPCWTQIYGEECELFCTAYLCIPACSGDPCPSGQINAAVEAINANHGVINTSRENIENLFGRAFNQEINGKNLWEYCPRKTEERLRQEGVIQDRTLKDLVLCLLDESRRGLSRCTTASGVDPLEEGKWVLTCEEAGGFGALSEKQEEQCYQGNFYCCYFK